MKKYYRGCIRLPIQTETEKAIGFTVSSGHFGRGHDSCIWLPKSQVTITEIEDVGDGVTIAEILIPAWLLDKNNINFNRINEIDIFTAQDDVIWK